MVFEKPVEDVRALSTEIIRRVNEDTRRIRNIEQRIDKLENSISTLEEAVLTQTGEIKVNLERIIQKVTSFSDKLTGIESEILRLNKELGKAATKSEVKQIETFIDIVNPITAKFVTRDELDRQLKELSLRK
jgi:predicted  nucleic acid-binding Zn-ribbon protein